MIRWLSKDEWKDLIENEASVGTYISHTLINKKVNSGIDKYHFPDSIIKVKVRQTKSNKTTDIYFNNNGIVKIQGDKHDEFDESAEYMAYYNHPHLIGITCYFISMMIKKFGVRYLMPRATHCKEELEECITDIPFHTSDADTLTALYGKINTNLKTINQKPTLETIKSINDKKFQDYKNRRRLQILYPELNIPLVQEPERTKMDRLIDEQINYEIKDKADELEYLRDYISLQESFLDFIAYEYSTSHNNDISSIVNYERN